MRDMAVAVCELAIRKGQEPFSALDLPTHGQDEHGGSGIAGSVFRILADSIIIAPVGAFVEGEFLQRRVRNEHGNPIGLWRLESETRAMTLLLRWRRDEAKEQQMEMAI